MALALLGKVLALELLGVACVMLALALRGLVALEEGQCVVVAADSAHMAYSFANGVVAPAVVLALWARTAHPTSAAIGAGLFVHAFPENYAFSTDALYRYRAGSVHPCLLAASTGRVAAFGGPEFAHGDAANKRESALFAASWLFTAIYLVAIFAIPYVFLDPSRSKAQWCVAMGLALVAMSTVFSWSIAYPAPDSCVVLHLGYSNELAPDSAQVWITASGADAALFVVDMKHMSYARRLELLDKLEPGSWHACGIPVLYPVPVALYGLEGRGAIVSTETWRVVNVYFAAAFVLGSMCTFLAGGMLWAPWLKRRIRQSMGDGDSVQN
jgi:hypothetical protein